MSLVEMSAFVKKAIIILGLLIAAYLLALILKAPAQSLYLAVFPPQNEPTVTFGRLPPLEFTEADIPPSNPEYVLNTTTGNLPADIETVVPVYRYVQPRESFSAGQEAQEYAQTLGFSDDMRVSELSADVFRWEDVTYGGVLEVDLGTKVIELNTPLGDKGRFYPAGTLNKTSATQIAKNVLSSLDKFTGTLYEQAPTTDIEVEFGKFRANGLIKADSILEAQIAKVDFYREINEYPILGPNPEEGLLQVYVRSPMEENPQLNYPVLHAYEWEIDESRSGTYPLTPLTQVWEQVRNNQGIIVNATPSNSNPFASPAPSSIDRILVNDIYIAYYDSTEYQQYAQPIYVFEGSYNSQSGQSGELTIYYPAISSEYIQSNQ